MGLALRALHFRFGIAFALHFDLRRGLLDVPEIIGRKLDGGCADILFEAAELGGAGDRYD